MTIDPRNPVGSAGLHSSQRHDGRRKGVPVGQLKSGSDELQRALLE
jgi:hypothetical protein